MSNCTDDSRILSLSWFNGDFSISLNFSVKPSRWYLSQVNVQFLLDEDSFQDPDGMCFGGAMGWWEGPGEYQESEHSTGEAVQLTEVGRGRHPILQDDKMARCRAGILCSWSKTFLYSSTCSHWSPVVCHHGREGAVQPNIRH